MDQFSYKISYSGRRTISITVSPDKGVIVKAPNRTPVRIIEELLIEKSGWINKAMAGFTSLKRIDEKNSYSDGDKILLFGRLYQVKIIPELFYSVRLVEGDIIEVRCRNNSDPVLIGSVLEKWFSIIAREKLTSKYHDLLRKYSTYGFNPSDFVVRKMKKRWGSCSSKGKIAVSYDLIRLDEIFGEYVIVHELCHLRHHNHSADYYRLLSEVYPGWKMIRKELQTYLR